LIRASNIRSFAASISGGNPENQTIMSTEVNIFSGRASRYLAKKIAKSYGKDLGDIILTEFSDGEFQPSFEENIRGHVIFIVQSTFAPADNLLELLMLVDAAKRASAKNIIAVIPYFGFARQDRKDKPRVSIASKLIANLLTAAGVSRVITIDLHADQIQGFFDVPVDHLFASSIFIPYIKQLNLPELVMASPDTGGTRRAAAYGKMLKTGFVICYKQRIKHNEVDTMSLIGDVKGKDVILIDDIIDTGNTICKAAELMVKNGASSVRGFCTHPLLTDHAYENIENSAFTEVVVTDTIPLKKYSSKITVLTTAELLAKVIKRVHNFESISSLFELKS
jgi:ribose-phosphate pyrophosphokinase